MSSGLSRHISIRSPNETMGEYMLKPGKNTIGRKSECDIHVADDAASRQHAEIAFDVDKNTITVVDLNSTNGTFINGKKIRTPHVVVENDVLRIGHLLISFLPLQTKVAPKNALDFTKSIVTGDLVLESLDKYSVVLHDIGLQLINVPELPVALGKITRLLMRMIGAEKCSIVMVEKSEEIRTLEIPDKIFLDLVKENTATIFKSLATEPNGSGNHIEPNSGDRLVAPVQIREKTVAIISATKLPSAAFPFNSTDIQIVIAVSFQVSLAIQRNQLETQLLHNATHDNLTGLPNRSMFIDRLEQALELSKRNKDYIFAVLFLDIDDFKLINDNRGHEIGDNLLAKLSARLDKHLRKTDTLSYLGSIARFGGDEFAVLLTGLKNDLDALSIANRVCVLATDPFTINGHTLEISLSVGLTTNKLGYLEPDEMLRDADIAMYRAKDSGKNRVELYDKEFHGELMERLERQNAVKKALELQEFRVHYQPIVSIESGRIIGHEALLRWYSPDHGIVSPQGFIDLLDTGNLLASVDQWVLREACLQTMRWTDKFPSNPQLNISVNFSPNNFLNPKIVQHISQILEETKLPPKNLWIEITENVSLDISEIAHDILSQLHDIGIRICIDDFGKGYSALNYLINLPIDVLKIDTSLIHRIDEIEESRKITNAVVSLAKQLEMEIVAEGIEGENQLSVVTKIGCEYAQGYHFGKPVLPVEAEKLLK